MPHLTNESIFSLRALPRQLLIIGGGFMALELAQAFQRFGSEVHVFERGERVLASAEPEVSEAIRGYLAEEGVQIHTGSSIEAAAGAAGGVELTAAINGSTCTFRGTHLLLAAGRVANTDGSGLERVGVATSADRFVVANAEMQTSAAHIWAAGDVVGPPMATPVAAREGVVAAENAIGGKHLEMDLRVLPRAVFTDPEVASVGLTEAQANAQGYSCRCRALDLSNIPKAAAIRDTRGLIKMVVENGSDRILGVHMVANRAADVIHEAALALRRGLGLSDAVGTLHVYPTMSEALKIAAQSFTRDIAKLSCCAE